jgi:uncharacterized membrane protein
MRSHCVLVVISLSLCAESKANEPAKKYQVITPKNNGIVATGINGRGEIVGFEWVEDKKIAGVLNEAPIFAQGKKITYLPLLEGYTATFPAAVSDDGVIVGRAGKPAPPNVRVPLRNQGFVWDAKTGMHGLGVLEGDLASAACGITRDGRRICGWSLGDNRMRACVWDKTETTWKAVSLPMHAQLGSPHVAISDNGKQVASIDGTVACLWTQDADGKWSRRVISRPGALAPRSVNNSGIVAGVRSDLDGRTHAVIHSRETGYKQLQEPQGYVNSQANAVNNDGIVVGQMDGPGGSQIGPNAFVYENGRLRVLAEGGKQFTAATAINDHGQVAGVFEEDEDEAPGAARKPLPKKAK